VLQSDWLSGHDWSTPNKLITFLEVCGVPAREWRSWIEAVAAGR